ncbi:MAG: Omp28-related outer membrane protein [Prevotella sp.]|uniref:Omp28-related outer membrane protein n=1 Tax=Prevotella sp. TaxID=59823 RepID=UPI002A2689A0|nr:Omp28-related outer membrane protein [Prevotella sp.]MDD7318772.1 Omp28-related outer membrane protein [Prevotellaceae bacterium]MDY4019548.1 Omp28-related outer membrane protein [Prevotella sp.]
MKKLLLTLVAAFMVLGLSAQGNMLTESRGKSVEMETSAVKNKVNKTPVKKITLGENQRLLGSYTTEDLAEYGSGIPTKPGQLIVATELPMSIVSMFNGGRIVTLRIGLACPTEDTKIYVGYMDKLGKVVDGVSQAVTSTKKGWNEITLATPYVINTDNMDGLFIGYECKQKGTKDAQGNYTDECYPWSFVKVGETVDTYVHGNLGAQGTTWYRLNTSGQMLSVQAVVEFDNIPDNKLLINGVSIDKSYYKVGDKIKYTVGLDNFGKQNISNYVLDVAVDGNKVSSYNGTSVINSGASANINGEFVLPNVAVGSHKLKISVKSLNGVDAPAPEEFKEVTFNSFMNSVPRQKLLLEQFTSQYCTYCPLGTKLLNVLKGKRSDLALVAVHGNMSSKDKFNTKQCDSIMSYVGVSGFPTICYNRAYLAELAEGEDDPNTIVYSLGYKEQFHNQVADQLSAILNNYSEKPSFVPVNINTGYDAESRKLTVTVSGTGVENASELLADNGLYVYLTEDNLKAYQTSGGSNYVHNNTFRVALGTVKGNNINWNGDSYENTYTYTVPADYVTENMHVIAFVAPKFSNNIDRKKLDINNCEVVTISGTSGIEDMTIEGGNVEIVARYNAAGQQISAPETGVNILKLSNGKTVKVVVK